MYACIYKIFIVCEDAHKYMCVYIYTYTHTYTYVYAHSIRRLAVSSTDMRIYIYIYTSICGAGLGMPRQLGMPTAKGPVLGISRNGCSSALSSWLYRFGGIPSCGDPYSKVKALPFGVHLRETYFFWETATWILIGGTWPVASRGP